ncbi:hypothetical protein [Rhizobium rhizogenes]|uniref:hypothetical protein n=1 Tax=Rhizobium rhizogenes TaxID=359 RepID=UPI0015742763|nr:hypothetical protein [Rhizobium rhizogenes]NTF46638.1 hypothetical protein [Rhizobium rhizogenes]
MTTPLNIYVMNKQSKMQSFYFFQQPAIYTGGGTAYSNSLYSSDLLSYDQSGAVLVCQVKPQYFAGIEKAGAPPQVGQRSGWPTVSRAIDLADGGSGAPKNWTTATVSPLGLSDPVNAPGVQPGAFRITTPSFNSYESYNAGSAIVAMNRTVLSNFVQANPMYNIDCQPILKFYVQTGYGNVDTVIDFSESSVNAGLADFTGGHTQCDITLNADGTWSTRLQ